MIPDTLLLLFLLFITYCIMGWVWESIYMSVIEKKLQNRGSLRGPYIPIYGFAGMFVFFTLGRLYSPLAHINTLYIYLIGMIGATTIEYFTAVLIEHFFHTRLWTYDGYFMNYKGRICLIASLFWGLISVLFVQVINPGLVVAYTVMNHDLKIIVIMFFGTLMVYDTAYALFHALDIPEWFAGEYEEKNERWQDLMTRLERIKK